MVKIRNLFLIFSIMLVGCMVSEPPRPASTIIQETQQPTIDLSSSLMIETKPSLEQIPIELTPTPTLVLQTTFTPVPTLKPTLTAKVEITLQPTKITSTPTPIPYVIKTDTFIKGVSEPPIGILKEIDYFSGGGGTYCRPSETYEQPKVIEMNIFWPVGISTKSCGWDIEGEEEKVSKIVDPYGNELPITRSEIDANFGDFDTIHELSPISPFGTYQLKLQIGDDILEMPIEVLPLEGPTLYWFVDENKIPEKILLVFFQPYETVKIFRYDEKLDGSTDFRKKLIGWQEFTVDEQGNLLISLDGETHWQDMYFGVGDISGEALFRELTPYGLQTDTHIKNPDLTIISKNTNELNSNNHVPTTINCSSAPKSRLNVGFRAQVTFTDGSPNRIRDLPASANVLGTAPEGTGMLILDGPVCDNERIWWKVQTDNGYTGWTAEGAQEEYWLEPVNE